MKKFWNSLTWYEVLTAVMGLLILVAAFVTWWFGDRTLKWAVDVAAPTCLAWGALSIILLWAQLRAAYSQERAEQVWKRVMCLHQHFHDVPRLELTDAVRGYLRELGVQSPPSAYSPLTPADQHFCWRTFFRFPCLAQSLAPALEHGAAIDCEQTGGQE